jgi:uncharacterized membrane protein
MTWKCAIVAAMAMMLAPATAQADSSVGGVENARAKERQGGYLTREDRDNLRRYGGNDDYGYSYGYGTYEYGGYGDAYYADDDYDDGPGVGIYLGD